MRRAFFLLLLLSGCASGAGFPSLLPRPGEVPRDPASAPETPAGLSPAEREALAASLNRARDALALALDDIARARKGLEGPLARAGGSPGSDGWAAAQLALSRLDQARAALTDIAVSLQPAAIVVDALAPEDPDRAALESLRLQVEEEARAAADLATRAGRALGT